MLAQLRAKAQEDEGFTLIELLVVIIIIGILAAIAIPVFLNQRKKATEASIASDLRTIANEMETYYVDNQTYPVIPVTSSNSIVIGANTVTLSKNNVAAASPAVSYPGTICVAAYNTDLGVSSVRYYNGARGGLQPKGALSNC